VGNRGRPVRIELIEPGFVTTFAPVPAAPRPGPPARRWPRLIAPLTLVAIIGLVAVVAAGGDGFGGHPTAAPSTLPRHGAPTSATAVTAPGANAGTAGTLVTAPPPLGTVAVVTAPAAGVAPGNSTDSTSVPLVHLVGTLPDGYQPAAALESPIAPPPPGGTPTAAVLWADGLDAAPATRWLLADAWPEGSSDAEAMSLVGAVRVDTARGPAVVHRDGGVTTITGPIEDGLVSLRSTGIALDDLTHIVAVMRLVDDRLTVDDTVLRMGFHLVAQATADSSVAWAATAHTEAVQTAASPGRQPATLSVDIGPEMSGFQQALQSFFLVARQRVDVGGRSASFGTDTGTGRRMLSLDRDGVHVDVSGAGQDDQAILDYAASLQPVPTSAWQAMLAATPRPVIAASGGRVQRRLIAGTLPGQITWLVKFGVDPALPDSIGFEFDQSSADGPRYAAAADLDAGAPRITAAATPTLTFVAAAVPAGTDGALLRITVGTTTIDTPLAAADGTPARLAVVVFGDVGAYTARIVATDGTVLAVFEPLGAPAA
jgi:hypothetical protein